MNDTTSGLVKSDLRLFTILEGLQELDGAGVTELADHVGMGKSSVHKHLKTLEREEYVVNDGGDYRLGFKFLHHGGHVRDRNPLCNLARPRIRELADETDMMVLFAVKEHDYGIYVYLQNDRYGLRDEVPLGEQFHLHQNASGKAMLARLDDEAVDRIIDRRGLPRGTDNTISDRDALFERLETVREEGIATSFEERMKGLQAVSTAVHDPETDTLGAIGLAGPADHLASGSIREEYADTVREAANELELAVRYRS